MALDWNEPSARGRGWTRWLWLPLAAGGVLVVGVLSVVLRQQGTRTRIWPIVRQTAQRLQTDAGALDLYRRNPDLRLSYPTEEAFLARVKTFRGGLSGLPAAEPQVSRDAYLPSPNPWGFQALVKGQSEAWMLLRVQGPGPFGLGPQSQGEGISLLALADSKAGAREESRAGQVRRRQPEWDAYRAVLAALATDDGSRALYRQNPGLAKAYPAEAAFLAAAKGWRPRLQPVPEDILQAGDHLRLLRIHHGPFHNQVQMTYEFPTLRLRAAWDEDRLTVLGPATEEDDAPGLTPPPEPPAPPAPPGPSRSGGSAAPGPRD